MSCMVVWDDDNTGVCCPMGDDPEWQGALCVGSKARVFGTRSEARKAIRISVKYWELHGLLGIPQNSDFAPECRKNLKVMELVGI